MKIFLSAAVVLFVFFAPIAYALTRPRVQKPFKQESFGKQVLRAFFRDY